MSSFPSKFAMRGATVFGLFTLLTALFASVFALGCEPVDPGISIVPCTTPTNADPEPDIVIGARLRPYELVANDGTIAVVPGPFTAQWTWFDTKLGVPCAFRSVDGGEEMHCIPKTIIALPNNYSDAACTQQVAIVDACARRPKYASVATKDVCWPGIESIRPLGEPLPVDAPIYRLDSANNCVLGQPTDAAKEVLPIGDVLSWDTFVAATQGPKLE